MSQNQNVIYICPWSLVKKQITSFMQSPDNDSFFSIQQTLVQHSSDEQSEFWNTIFNTFQELHETKQKLEHYKKEFSKLEDEYEKIITDKNVSD